LKVKKSPTESYTKQGGFYPAAHVLFGKANTILVNKDLKAISRFNFQDSVDADAFHRGGNKSAIPLRK